MLETYWDQSPYYNAFCPYDTNELKMTPCGCTATATGQIMKYYNYPASGHGSKCYTHPEYGDQCADYGNTQYLWDSMPVALSGESSAAQVNAVATLLYHIGVAVDMDYSPQGSGGKTANYGNGAAPSSENAFKYNFGYSPYIYTAFQSDYSLAEWKRLMKNELNEGRPVLYAGYDEQQEGHAFVCDGYNMQGKFHFNWGWSGNGDGFYSLDDLNPHSTLGNMGLYFNHFGTATIGIEPFDEFGTATTINVEVAGVDGASTEGCTVSGAGHYNFGDTVILLARATQESMRFVSWSDGCRYNPRETVATGGNLTFTALFAPLCSDTIYYSTCGNAMNRDAKADTTMGKDSIWGIRLPASALRAHHNLTAVEFMGKDTATYILTVYGGTEQPEEILYRDTLTANFPYPYSWYSHTLTAPTIIDGAHSVWVVLKCTEISKPGIFSLYGGNGDGLLAGESLTPRNDLYSWMIRCFFEPDGTRIEVVEDPEQITLYPNPASGILHIDVKQASGPAQMQVTDLTGRVVMTRHISDMANRTALDVSHLPKGLYMLRITADGTCHTAKFSVR